MQPGEGYLNFHNSILLDYVEQVSSRWSEKWENMSIDVFKNRLRSHLGQSIESYLSPDGIKEDQYIITKTPFVNGLNDVETLFPGSKIIIVIRDGKQVVESLVSAFKWLYLHAMKEYKNSAQAIIKFQESCNNVCVVRYEDFCREPDIELSRIFKYLELDSDSFDFEKFHNLPVLGATVKSEDAKDFVWKVNTEIKKRKPYKQLNWHPLMVARYNSICGEEAKHFQYDNEDVLRDNSFSALGLYIRYELREIKKYFLIAAKKIGK